MNHELDTALKIADERIAKANATSENGRVVDSLEDPIANAMEAMETQG